jgi:pyridoxamine 5'-phosphate oxidase
MDTIVSLSELSADKNPFIQFDKWFRERLSGTIDIPNTMSLATASVEAKASLRTVLLKGFDERGFLFYTNYNSRKGLDIGSNPFAALLFYWPESARQVRIEGTVSRASGEESDIYFDSRPEESRLSAWASEQSSSIPGREYLENRFEFYRNAFLNKHINRPPYWGGFRLMPDWFEFWQEGKFRLHDRITYSLSEGIWTIMRLAP